jgi:putative ABC transport system substrate-binding protein
MAAFVSATAWPAVAWAQQPERVRRIGVLMGLYVNSDPYAKELLTTFTQELSELQWAAGRNVRIDIRWANNVELMRTSAKELVDLQPDVMLVNSTPATAALQREARTVPIVFVDVADPIGSGIVASLTHPGGNITGFINQEASLSGKWLELLREISPAVKRAAIIFNPNTAPSGGSYYLPAFETAARLLDVVPIVAPVQSVADIETVITSLGRESGGGLIVMNDAFNLLNRRSIISFAARSGVPAAFGIGAGSGVSVRDGGLLSYGQDSVDLYRRVLVISIAFFAVQSRPTFPFSCRPNSRCS